MCYIYVIESLKNKKRYTGYTSKLPEERLKEHNRGCNKWTKKNKPFKLIYSENINTIQEAIKKERYLKTGKGREYIQYKIPA